jgi:hypothetical protein
LSSRHVARYHHEDTRKSPIPLFNHHPH